MDFSVKILLILGAVLSAYSSCTTGCLRCNTSTTTPSCSICDFRNNYVPNDSGSCDLSPIVECDKTGTNGDCFACNDNFYYDSNTKTCLAVTTSVKDCRTYTGPATCSVCTSGFYLNNNACVKITGTAILRCNVYSSATTCSECKTDYIPSISKTSCIKRDANKEIENCSNYRNYYCKRCDLTVSFLQKSSYLLKPFDTNNSTSIQDVILKLNRGSTNALIQSVCITTSITHCTTFSSYDKCFLCDDGYYVDTDGSCTAYVETDLTGCLYFTVQNTCIECDVQYYLVGSICVLSTYVENCNAYEKTTDACAKCDSGYYLSGGICQTRVNAVTNCLEYVVDEDKCSTCQSGFELYDTGLICVDLPDNCLEYATYNPLNAETTCGKCGDGYFLENGACSLGTDVLCKEFVLDEDVCTKCKPGYAFDENGDCVALEFTIDNCADYFDSLPTRCDTCDYKSSKFYQTSICQSIISIQNCITYSDINTCSACDSGYVLNNNICDEIPESEHCNSKEEGVCTRCVDGFELVETSCVDVPNQYELNCDFSDLSTDGISYKCIGCETGAIPIDNIDEICVEAAAQNFTKIDHCNKYYNDNDVYKCKYCDPAYVLSNDSTACLSECPEGQVRYLGDFTIDNSQITINAFSQCLDLDDLVDLSPGCTTASHNLKGSGNVCMKCADDYIPIESCPLNNTFFNINNLSIFNEGQAFSTIDCLAQPSGVVFHPTTGSPDPNCKHYSFKDNNYYCRQCKFGKTGVIINADTDQYYIDCSASVAGCETSVRLGSGLNDDSWLADMYGFSLTYEFTCHVCTNSSEIPFIHLDNNNKLKSYKLDDNELIPSEAADTNGEMTVCREPTKEGLHIPDANFNSFVANCALGVYIVDIQKAAGTAVPSARCIACKDGFERTLNSSGYFIESCTPISNCDSQPTSGWLDGCKHCDTTHVKIIENGKIDPHSCDHEVTSPNCKIYDATADKCVQCDRGYYLDEDDSCISLSVPYCPSYAHPSTLSYKLADESDNYSFAYYFGATGFDCYSCDSDYLSIKVSDSRSLCSTFDGIEESSASYLIANCASYYRDNQSSLKCHQCDSEHILDQNNANCYSDSSLTGCKIASTDSECYECQSGYLIKDGICYELNIENCATYVFDGATLKCTTCVSEFVKDGDACVEGDIENCGVYVDADTCSNCIDGYYLLLNYCLPIPSYSNCTQAELTVNTSEFNCQKCASNYLPTNEITSTDYPICLEGPLTDDCIEHDANFVCQECSSSYFLSDGECKLRTYTNTNCRIFLENADGCEYCASKFYLDNSVCKAVVFSILYCSEYKTDATCAFCTVNRYLKDGKCALVPNASKINNCSIYNANLTCYECTDGYTKIGDACLIKKGTGCQTYAANGCNSCEAGKSYSVANVNGANVRNCVETVIQNCIEINFVSGRCKTCASGYFPKGQICDSVTTTISNCFTYSSATKCSVCNTGYIINTAGTSCSLESDVNTFEPNCIDLRYEDSPVCTACRPGSLLNSSSCALCESPATFKDGCMYCAPKKSVSETQTCLICLSGYYMNTSGSCVSYSNGLMAEYDDEDSDESVGIFGIAVTFFTLLLIFIR